MNAFAAQIIAASNTVHDAILLNRVFTQSMPNANLKNTDTTLSPVMFDGAQAHGCQRRGGYTQPLLSSIGTLIAGLVN